MIDQHQKTALMDVLLVLATLVLVKQALLPFSQLLAGPASTSSAMILATALLWRRQRTWHELGMHSTTCGCGCQLVHIGDDISEKLDYEPGTFSVERHIRSKWACKSCETVVQAPVAPHLIDKGIPTTRLLTHVLVSKYADHQPLYREPSSMTGTAI